MPSLLTVTLVVAFLANPTIGMAQDMPTVTLVGLHAKTPKKAPLSGRWLGARIHDFTARLGPECYAVALAKSPRAAGDIQVRATVWKTGRVGNVTTSALPGAKFVTQLRACMRRIFAGAGLDMHPLPPVKHDPDLPGAYYDPPGDAPKPDELPLRLELTWRFTPPSAEPPVPIITPEPSPGQCRGPSPAGCRATGCGPGLRCDTHVSCVPSSCGCQPETGAWVCTADCGGGVCVPDDSPPNQHY